jgi:hypothetical protein
MMARQKTHKSLFEEVGRSPTLRSALAQLLEAHRLAASSGRPDADFAVELPSLILAGGSPSAIRWLVINNLALHFPAGERLAARGEQADGFEFSERSRFALTERGLEIARAAPADCPPPAASPARSPRPRWDETDLELWFLGRVVLRLSAKAFNQIRVLNAFQEDHWCRRILDPLPGGHPDAKKRLSNVVYHLNDGLIEPTLGFCADGDGTGVTWHPTDVARTPRARIRSQVSSK